MAVRMSYIFLLAFIGGNLYSAFAEDVDEDACGGVCMRFLKRTGRLALIRCGNGKKRDFIKEALIIQLARIRQLDNLGKPIGRPVDSGAFAKQDFTYLVQKSHTYQGLKCIKATLKTYLPDPKANLRIEVYSFCEAGEITFGDDAFEVQNGTVKYLVKLDNFTFCDGTNNTDVCPKRKIGKSLEIGITVKDRKGKAPKDGDGEKKSGKAPKCSGCKRAKQIQVGDDKMSLAGNGQVDGVFRNLSASPGIRAGVLLFRMPKCRSCIIDPTIDLKEDDDDDDDDSGQASIQLNAFMFVIMLTGLFTFM